MTPDQFKAWFEGFCEAIDAAPTPEQWAKIKAKVADIREKPAVTFRDADFARKWVDTTPRNGLVTAPNTGFAANGFSHPVDKSHPHYSALVGAPVSHETRVVDALTGADLGPSD